MNARVLLIHGTWGAGAEWKNEASEFQRALRADLEGKYERVEFEALGWSARNWWRARARTAGAVEEKLVRYAAEDDPSWEYFLVAHSHGGNIALESARRCMKRGAGARIRGIVCMNTPFLKQELRASGNYLGVWVVLLLVTLVFLALTGSLGGHGGMSGAHEWPGREMLGVYADANGLTGVLAGLTLALFALVLLARRLRMRPREESAEERFDAVRPKVLCLSCPDDEAITLLGFLEGVSNLPQLLLHPTGVAAVACATFWMWRGGSRASDGTVDPQAWFELAHWLALTCAAWVSVALAGGLIGAVVVSALFGLPPREVFNNLLSRVLVSYVPLQPADCYFRGITEVARNWLNPIQLFHSQIYRAPQAIVAIREWLQHVGSASLVG